VLEPAASPAPALSPVARKAIDYSDLETWMAHADNVIRQTRRNLDQLPQGLRRAERAVSTADIALKFLAEAYQLPDLAQGTAGHHFIALGGQVFMNAGFGASRQRYRPTVLARRSKRRSANSLMVTDDNQHGLHPVATNQSGFANQKCYLYLLTLSDRRTKPSNSLPQ
jgi:hypothetical protein